MGAVGAGTGPAGESNSAGPHPGPPPEGEGATVPRFNASMRAYTSPPQERPLALHTWLLYLVDATVLSLTPGPNSLLALAR